jgi:hypothetical protein
MSRFSFFPLVVAAALSGCGENTTSRGNETLEGAEPLVMSPANAVAYNGSPVSLYITGGTRPYTITSSNSAVISVPNSVSGSTVVFDANNVAADTPVSLDVLDAKGVRASSSITVKPSVINQTLTVTPDPATPGTGCGTAVCSGMMGLVTVQLKNLVTPLVNRSVRFDVVQGDYRFITDAGATTFADSFTVNTDQNGYAHVRIMANTNAPTQYALLKVTDVAGGSVLQTAFTIAQYTDGAGILSVVPTTRTITAYFKGECSSGVLVDYIIHGGTPPYSVTSTDKDVATVFPASVLTNGGGFTATTHSLGVCPGTTTIDIVDATGRVIQASLFNNEGTNTTVPPAPVALFVTSTTATVPVGANASVAVGGGYEPYNVSSSNLAVATASLAGTTITITGVAAGTSTVTVTDALGASKTIAVTVVP